MSCKSVVVCLIFAFLTPSVFWAQKSSMSTPPKKFRPLVRAAKKMVDEDHLAEAAAYLEMAYQLKPQKTEIAYQSALLYLISREYQKAVALFRPIIGEQKFKDIHLEFAQALQQSGEWDEAMPEFLFYLNNYKGKDREKMAEKIGDYIAGCSLAIKESDSTKINNIFVEHLNENINTQENDIAPVPFGDNVLYFTSRWQDAAKLLRSRFLGTDWSPAEPLTSLPIPETTPIGNGTFSPDGSRFYCTMCQEVSKKKQKRCGIYYLKRTKEGWTTPIRLSDRINHDSTDASGMTTQPYVIHKGNSEILFFTSNRKGGRGGMDIWMASRVKNKENSDFDTPMNLGAIINTEGDEVTPFYDDEEQMLYFASNGRATMGGLDIFKSYGSLQYWTSPQNMGTPFNSSADDWYFVKNKSKTGGFFVSNRTYGIEKFSSRDDDIYSFIVNNKRELLVSGQVFDKNSKSLLENVRLSLYEKRATDDSDLRLLSSVVCSEGKFQFTVLPQKSYMLEAEKDGFRIGTTSFLTIDSLKNDIRDFYLERYVTLVSNHIIVSNEVSKKEQAVQKASVADAPPTQTRSVEKTIVKQKETQTESKPAAEKSKQATQTVKYKIQVMAYETDLDNVNIKRLKRVEDLGEFETETAVVNGKRFTRVMLSFDTLETATAALRKAKERSLNDAFIVRYENDKRVSSSK